MESYVNLMTAHSKLGEAGFKVSLSRGRDGGWRMYVLPNGSETYLSLSDRLNRFLSEFSRDYVITAGTNCAIVRFYTTDGLKRLSESTPSQPKRKRPPEQSLFREALEKGLRDLGRIVELRELVSKACKAMAAIGVHATGRIRCGLFEFTIAVGDVDVLSSTGKSLSLVLIGNGIHGFTISEHRCYQDKAEPETHCHLTLTIWSEESLRRLASLVSPEPETR